MFPTDRKKEILRLLRRTGNVRVADLAEGFGVTEETVRRDLDQLEQEGHLRRVYGGAVAAGGTGNEAPILEREGQSADLKRQIGRAAVALLRAGDTCMLDASTTALELARQMPDVRMTVVTNSVPIVMALSGREHLTVIGVGGILRSRSLSFVGPLAEQTVRQYRVDKAFLSCSGLHPTGGLTDSNLLEVAVKQAMVESAREVIGLADSTKWGKAGFATFAPMASVHKVITDAGAPADLVSELRERGIEVIAGPEHAGNGSRPDA